VNFCESSGFGGDVVNDTVFFLECDIASLGKRRFKTKWCLRNVWNW